MTSVKVKMDSSNCPLLMSWLPSSKISCAISLSVFDQIDHISAKIKSAANSFFISVSSLKRGSNLELF